MIEVEQYLAALTTIRKDYSNRLAVVKGVLDQLGSPQDKIPAIHIAGTSGKGSTAYYAAELLTRAGYTTGLAVSPHVNSVAERSQVNGGVLPESIYCEYFNRFISILDRHNLSLSYIEFLTIFTYWLFAELKLDYMVIEVGLGGRLDPTNTITRPRTVRVITDIGLDHTEILGDTLAAITGEKAGIIHAGDMVVIHEQPSEVLDVITTVVADVRADLIVVHGDSIQGSVLPAFQQRNWTLARRAVAERLATDGRSDIPQSATEASLALVIPGRFEYFAHSGVSIILDAAHNPQKIRALVMGIKSTYPDKRAIFVVAFGENKRSSVKEGLQLIYPVASSVIATLFTSSTGMERTAITPRDIAEVAKVVGFNGNDVEIMNDPYDAVWRAIYLARQRDLLVVVTGSFYLIDGIRALLARGTEEL